MRLDWSGHFRHRFLAALALIGLSVSLGMGPAGTPTSAFAADPLPIGLLQAPKLDSDVDKLNFLLSVQERMPTLFEDAAKYSTSLLGILDDQNRLKSGLLRGSTEYHRLAAKRTQLLDITVRPDQSTYTRAYRVVPEAIDHWRSELLATLKGLGVGPGSDWRNDLIQALIRAQAKLQDRTSQGLLTGLIQSVPGPQKAELFKLPSDSEKLARIREILPEKLPPAFRGAAYGLPAEAHLNAALARYQELHDLENEVRRLMELHLVAQNVEGTLSENRLSAEGHIAKLDAMDLQFFAEREDLQKRAVGLVHALQEVAPASKFSVKDIQSRVKSSLQARFSEQEVYTEKLGKALRVREVPAEVAIFRGCTGGDCATMYSFPYPNSPAEHVFFIENEEGRIKGYATSSVVTAQDKTHLYVSTISGPRISTGDTELVMRALQESAPRLGATAGILLPETGMHFSLFNYLPARKAIGDAVRNGVTTPIQFTDVHIRQAIQHFKSDFNTGTYDHISLNSKAVEPPAEFHRRLPVRVEIAAHDYAVPAPKVATTMDALGFALELEHADYADDAKRVLNAFHIPHESLATLTRALTNPGKYSVEAFQSMIFDVAQKQGISRAALEKRPYLFHQGLLAASDAFDVQNLPQTLPRLVEFLSKEPVDDPLMASILKNHHELLKTQPKFLAYVDGLVQGDFEELAQLQKLSAQFGIAPHESAMKILGARLAKETDPSMRHWLLYVLHQWRVSQNRPLDARALKATIRALDDPADTLSKGGVPARARGLLDFEAQTFNPKELTLAQNRRLDRVFRAETAKDIRDLKLLLPNLRGEAITGDAVLNRARLRSLLMRAGQSEAGPELGEFFAQLRELDAFRSGDPRVPLDALPTLIHGLESTNPRVKSNAGSGIDLIAEVNDRFRLGLLDGMAKGKRTSLLYVLSTLEDANWGEPLGEDYFRGWIKALQSADGVIRKRAEALADAAQFVSHWEEVPKAVIRDSLGILPLEVRGNLWKEIFGKSGSAVDPDILRSLLNHPDSQIRALAQQTLGRHLPIGECVRAVAAGIVGRTVGP